MVAQFSWNPRSRRPDPARASPLPFVLAHTAGLASVSPRRRVEDLYDWQRMTALLVAEPLWWEPGTALGYHGITQGYLVGEVVRR